MNRIFQPRLWIELLYKVIAGNHTKFDFGRHSDLRIHFSVAQFDVVGLQPSLPQRVTLAGKQRQPSDADSGGAGWFDAHGLDRLVRVWVRHGVNRP